MATAKISEIQFSDDDVLNHEDCIFAGDYNPHHVRGFLFHDHGFALAVVFAESLQEALDIAADHGKLERFALSDEEADDYDEGAINYVGNDCRPHDLESLQVQVFECPKLSIAKLMSGD
jgi:hypothetical protein